MRKCLLAALLVLLPGLAVGQDFIRYYPPQSNSAGNGFVGTSGGAQLQWDAANILALRNGGTAGTPVAQTQRIYYFCDGAACATGYGRGSLGWNASNEFLITAEAAGTGTQGKVVIYGSGGLYTTNIRSYNGSDVDSLGLGTAQWMHGYFSRSFQGSKSKTLTDAAAAASIWSCAVPTSDSIGGELIWTTESTDATDYRVTQGAVRFAGVNKAGTTTCTIGVIGTDLTASSNGNTLVCTWTNVASGTNCLLSATCTDNTAAAQTMAVNSRLDMPIPQVCTPQ
jgi:hypothetical protein